MAARPISFAVEETDVALLQELADAFGGGNRSEFLRVAMKEFKKKLRVQQMNDLHAEMLEERGGKVYTTEETLKQIEENWVP
ncbi:ribbon-helix-helix protein, CopG family [Microbacterium sp.]|uniref:ribbon-helix-helix protein, CopG family n=1 Tax=Microbacterium sp. TaxID=51671 RepID=UPI002736FE42|nr:ribbon-helix-helix protein, CopG family [Microbacterium sp.]MDP3949521.1 ribbon-helix-helix protein, CopG family [Microbacterium sp.]